MCCHESSPSKGKNNNNNNSKNNNKNTQHTAYLAYTKVLSHRVCVCLCVYVWEYIGRGNLSLSISLSAIPNSHCHSHAIANTHTRLTFFGFFLLFVLFPVWFQRSLFRLSDLSLSLALCHSLSFIRSHSVCHCPCVFLSRAHHSFSACCRK